MPKRLERHVGSKFDDNLVSMVGALIMGKDPHIAGIVPLKGTRYSLIRKPNSLSTEKEDFMFFSPFLCLHRYARGRRRLLSHYPPVTRNAPPESLSYPIYAEDTHRGESGARHERIQDTEPCSTTAAGRKLVAPLHKPRDRFLCSLFFARVLGRPYIPVTTSGGREKVVLDCFRKCGRLDID